MINLLPKTHGPGVDYSLFVVKIFIEANAKNKMWLETISVTIYPSILIQ
jgi:hypothetical protein